MKEAGIYQIKGPFTAGVNVIQSLLDSQDSSINVRVGISLDTKDWLPFGQTEEGFSFSIAGPKLNTVIQMGRTCMYETDQGISIYSIVFNQDAPQSTIVNLISYQE